MSDTNNTNETGETKKEQTTMTEEFSGPPVGTLVVTKQPPDDDPVVLRYVGEHGAIVMGVPATDLTRAQIKESGHTEKELLALTPAVYVSAKDAPKRASSKRRSTSTKRASKRPKQTRVTDASDSKAVSEPQEVAATEAGKADRG